MKIITDKSKNGLTPKEFTENLLVPVPKTEFTANIVNLISYALAWSFFVYLVFRPSRVSRTLHPLSL